MPDTSPTPDPDPQIQQEVKGDRNQTIGQVLGGIVVYGQVIYNNPAVASDQSTAKPEASAIGPNPYKGLLAFHETDGDRFFGREPQIKELWAKFRSLHEDESATRLLTIYGPSGSGKSSLARAGLIPELARRPLPGRDRARVAVMVPGSHPLEALATVLARIATEDATPVAKTREFAAELKEVNSEGIYDGLRRIGDALPEIANKPLIVLVDQLEELFTLCEDPIERDAFMGNVFCAINDRSKRVSAIITLRSDYLGSAQIYPWFDRGITEKGFYISAMNAEGLRDAITEPAKLAGYELDMSTVNLLLEQTKGREGALPLLQFALTEIWDGLLEGQNPTEKLNAIGGVSKALARKAEEHYGHFNHREKLQVKNIFIQLVSPDGEADYIRRIATRDEIGQGKWNLVTRLATQRLVVTSRNNISGKEVETVELVHETLIREWDRLHHWMVENRAFRTWQRCLRSAQKQWENSKKDNGALLRGVILAEAQDWLHKRPTDIVNSEKLFIELSGEVQGRSRRLIIQGLLGFSIIASYLTIVAAFGWMNADRQSQIASAERSSVSALGQLDRSPIDALVFAMEGGQVLNSLANNNTFLADYPTLHPVLALQTILDKIRLQNQIDTSERAVNSVTFNANLTLMVTSGEEGKVKLWKKNGKKIREIQAYPANIKINSIRFNSEGNKLAIAGKRGDAQIRNIEGKLLHTIHTNSVNGVRNIRFGHNEASNLLITSGYDGSVKLWNKKGIFRRELSDKRINEQIKLAHLGGIEVVNISKDDKQILTGGRDKLAKLWDIDGTLKAEFMGHTRTIKSARFHPDGKSIVTAGEDDTIRIWSRKGKFKFLIQGNQNGINAVDFYSGQIAGIDKEGDFNSYKLISAGNDGTIKVWDFRGKLLDEFKAHEGRIETIRVNSDQTLVTAGQEDGIVKTWKLPQKLEKLLIGHKKSVNSIRFSPDSQKIVTASSDGTVRLWDLNGNELSSFFNPETIKSGVESVRFIDKGKRLVTGGGKGDSKVRIWDLDGALRQEFDTKQGGIHSVNINDSDNINNYVDRILSTTGFNGSVKLWSLNGSLINTLRLKEIGRTSRFSLNGKFVVTAGNNGMVQVWDIFEKKILDIIWPSR